MRSIALRHCFLALLLAVSGCARFPRCSTGEFIVLLSNETVEDENGKLCRIAFGTILTSIHPINNLGGTVPLVNQQHHPYLYEPVTHAIDLPPHRWLQRDSDESNSISITNKFA